MATIRLRVCLDQELESLGNAEVADGAPNVIKDEFNVFQARTFNRLDV